MTSMLRTFGFTGILLSAVGLTVALPGCGGDEAGNAEVTPLPAKDEQGNVTYSINDEAKTPATAKPTK